MVKAHCLSVRVRDQAWRRRTCLPIQIGESSRGVASSFCDSLGKYLRSYFVMWQRKLSQIKSKNSLEKLLCFNCAFLFWNDLRDLADEMFSLKASFQTSVVANIKLD